MLMRQAPWRSREVHLDQVRELALDLDIDPINARLLALRGVVDATTGRRFLDKRLADLYRPMLMRDMDRAAARLARAIATREQILVHGDFDVDGSTSTTLLLLFCRACGHEATAFIPHRLEDGYGLSSGGFEAVRRCGATLMVTVDCGISDRCWAARIERELGCDVLITDHHPPGETLPDCHAVVDPGRRDCPYPDAGLAGVGVAWKLCWATACELCGGERVPPAMRTFLLDALALVAVGTVADCAPLDGENRILVHHGLRALQATVNPGLRALLAHCRVDGTPTASDIGWRLGPLLNASGRLGSAMRNVELLTTDDSSRAQILLAEAVQDNDERRRMSQQLTEELINQADDDPRWAGRLGLVFAGDDWHPGVVGIVASRLVERYGRPACVIAMDTESGRGSLRAPAGVDLGRVLADCAPHLLACGGHAQAAGLSISRGSVSDFAEAFEETLRGHHPAGLAPPAILHDGTVRIAQLDRPFFEVLAALAPFGINNPEPVLQLERAAFTGALQLFGREQSHVRGTITDGGGGLCAFLAWRARERFTDFSSPGQRFDLLIRPHIDHFRGEARHRLVFVDGCGCAA